MNTKIPTYVDLEPYLRDAKRLSSAIRQMHIKSLSDRMFSGEEYFLVLNVLLDRLVADTKASEEIFDAMVRGGNLVVLRP